MNRPTAVRFPLKSLLAVLAWQALGIVLLGLGLFLHYNPGHALATGALSGLAVPLLVAAGIMLACGCIWAISVAWRATRFLSHLTRSPK